MIHVGSLAALRTLSIALLLGSASISGAAYAQSSSQDPVACSETCQKEYDSCIKQMGTREMCGADHKVCTKICESN